MRDLDNSQDVIDSRDVIDRIEELQGERDTWEGAEPWDVACSLDADELRDLTALAEEAEGYAADWKYGETLVRYSYFTDYCRETLEDCGTIPKDFPTWVEIDWDATARNMQQDYTSVEFGVVTYWIR